MFLYGEALFILECALATMFTEQENVRILGWRVLPGHSGDSPGYTLCHQKLRHSRRGSHHPQPFPSFHPYRCVSPCLSMISLSPFPPIFSVTLKWCEIPHLAQERAEVLRSCRICRLNSFPLGPDLETTVFQTSARKFKKIPWKLKYECLPHRLCLQRRRWL